MQTPKPATLQTTPGTVIGADGVARTPEEHKKQFGWQPADGLEPLASKASLTSHALPDLVARRKEQDSAVLEAHKKH